MPNPCIVRKMLSLLTSSEGPWLREAISLHNLKAKYKTKPRGDLLSALLGISLNTCALMLAAVSTLSICLGSSNRLPLISYRGASGPAMELGLNSNAWRKISKSSVDGDLVRSNPSRGLLISLLLNNTLL